MNLENIKQCLQSLSRKRPIFHSEFDFQFELAWQIKSDYNEEIRLERPLRSIGEIDITVIGKDGLPKQIIELKYKTRAINHTTKIGEVFDITNHVATPIARCQVIKDLHRLENSSIPGFTIFLTNEPAYWTNAPEGLGADFSLQQGRIINGPVLLEWANEEKEYKGNKSIPIKGRHHLEWVDYSNIESHQFRYLLFQVS